MHGFLGSNKYAGGNGKLNCFLLLKIESEGNAEYVFGGMLANVFFGEQFPRNGFKIFAVFLSWNACKTLT